MIRSTTLHKTSRFAFTLVELLVAIAIIGILMAIAIPAVGRAITRGRETAMKLEINALAQAVEQYQQKYGDYPPDGSDELVLDRHFRRIFPRMAEPDRTLLVRLTDNSMAAAPTTPVGFSGGAMDRSEALVFFLGGFSDDTQHPLVGQGGPLAPLVAPASGTPTSTDLSDYQYNGTRDNSFFDFDSARLTIARATDTSPLISTDETLLGNVDNFHGGADLLPAYRSRDNTVAPILYFDSRSYGVISPSSVTPPVYNGYWANDDLGGVRPYKSELNVGGASAYTTVAEAFAAIPFQNPDTFQIVSPGMDGVYGAVVSISASDRGATPVHFVTESGRPVRPAIGAAGIQSQLFSAAGLGSRGFQDVDWLSSITVNGNLDNITNFSEATLEGDLQ